MLGLSDHFMRIRYLCVVFYHRPYIANGLEKKEKERRKDRRRKGGKDAARQCWFAACCIPSTPFTSIHTVNKSMEALTLGI